jgi:nitrate/TMAO reductase-like tetraheme cytochrome c subunit
MNRKRDLRLAAIMLAACGFLFTGPDRSGSAQQAQDKYKNNNCVACHSQLFDPLEVSNRYLEWQLSRHEETGVSCDKCHGGDPAAKDKEKAHAGVLPPADRRSRLHWKNQPETCKSCHQNVVSSFVDSVHYQRLQGIGLGPSCNTCHAHMATKVIYSPAETATLCGQCHDSINFIKPRPEIPVRAKETMTALQRADAVINWSQLLIAESRRRNLQLGSEERDLKLAEDTLSNARIVWHAFDLDVVRNRADDAFHRGTKVKDELRKKQSAE